MTYKKYCLNRFCFFKQLCYIGVLFSAWSWVYAQPVVIGNTINIESFAWHQVQRVDDLNDASEGFDQFIVDPGVYNVINLYNGERFEGVEVTTNNAERLRRLRDSEISIDVYSTTAMEVFWERVPFSGIRYEVYNRSVSRDEPVLVTDATSYFADNLDPGRFYNWTIVAVTDQNERIELKTVGKSTIIPITEPAAPSEAFVSLYSATAAELFWTRAEPTRSSGKVLANEIRRNGELLATLQGENLKSYFDDTREAGVRYLYEITAVFRDGSRKTTGVQSAAWTDPVTNPTSTSIDDLPANLRSALTQVESLITLQPLRDIEVIARDLITVIPQTNELVSETNDDSGITATYQCGEDAMLILTYSDERVMPLSAIVDGEGYCTVGFRQIRGFFGYRLTFPGDPENIDQNFSIIRAEIRDTSTNSVIQVGQARLSTLTDLPDVKSGSIRDYVRTDGVQSFSVSRLSTNLEDEDGSGNPVDPNRTITANGISGSGVEITSLQMLNRFSGFFNGKPTAGVLLVNEAGGSNFRINADSGDDNTYLVTGNDNGNSFGFLIPWSEGFSF